MCVCRCICICICLCMRICKQICSHMLIYSTYICIVYAYMYMYTEGTAMCIYILTHTYIYVCTHTYIRTYVRTRVHTYIHTCRPLAANDVCCAHIMGCCAWPSVCRHHEIREQAIPQNRLRSRGSRRSILCTC